MLLKNQDPISDWGKEQMAQEEVRTHTTLQFYIHTAPSHLPTIHSFPLLSWLVLQPPPENVLLQITGWDVPSAHAIGSFGSPQLRTLLILHLLALLIYGDGLTVQWESPALWAVQNCLPGILTQHFVGCAEGSKQRHEVSSFLCMSCTCLIASGTIRPHAAILCCSHFSVTSGTTHPGSCCLVGTVF